MSVEAETVTLVLLLITTALSGLVYINGQVTIAKTEADNSGTLLTPSWRKHPMRAGREFRAARPMGFRPRDRPPGARGYRHRPGG